MTHAVPTLTDYLLDHLKDHPEQHALVTVMNDLASIGKTISSHTNRAGLVGILGATGSENLHGEEVQKLDIFANDLCKRVLQSNPHIAAMASEEEDDPVDMGQDGAEGEYVIAFDPLDGSTNVDVNVSIGTIFSVHKKMDAIDRTDVSQFLQKGHEQVLAGYILYGSSTVLVFSFGDGVHEFTLDHEIGDYYLSNERVLVPDVCKIYSFNYGNEKYLQSRDAAFIEYLRDEHEAGSRYIGSLVADFHRNMLKGGVFMYPGMDKKGAGEFKGKLRLNYELKPMAFLLQQAGGLAVDGKSNILDITPIKLHERTPIIMGNKNVIEHYLTM